MNNNQSMHPVIMSILSWGVILILAICTRASVSGCYHAINA